MSVEEFYKERFGEDAVEELKKWESQVEEVSKKEIKLTSDLAWAQTMYRNGDCTCEAESRRECRCKRTEEYKERAKFIRELLFPEAWGEDPLEILAQNLNEKTSEEDETYG